MRTDLTSFSLPGTASIAEVLRQMDDNGLGICLVVDDGKLLGTITDGDVRRAVLRGDSFDSDAAFLMHRNPVTVSSEAHPNDIRQLFSEKRIRHIPAIDDSGKLVGLHVMRDLVSEAPETELPAVVMAGGYGSRLGDLTSSTPKPLLEVGGKPILERIVEHLQEFGVEQIFITTRYLGEQIEEHFGDGEQWGVSIEYVREKQRLGTAGSLGLLPKNPTGPFLVMNGDLLTKINVRQMFEFHAENESEMTVAVRHYTMNVPFGVVEVDGIEVQKLSEKPSFDFFVNAGVYIVAPTLLKYVSGDEMFDITELIETAIENGHRVCSFPVFEEWMDIGRPEDLEEAQRKSS